MRYLKFYIQPQNILDRLSEEEKKKFNKCVTLDVRREEDGTVEMTYILFKDEDETIHRPSDQPRYQLLDDMTSVGE